MQFYRKLKRDFLTCVPDYLHQFNLIISTIHTQHLLIFFLKTMFNLIIGLNVMNLQTVIAVWKYHILMFHCGDLSNWFLTLLFAVTAWLCVATHSCVTFQSAASSWVALPGSQPAHTSSAISMALESSVAHRSSVRPAPQHCRGSWISSGRSSRPLKTTRPWCWPVCVQT